VNQAAARLLNAGRKVRAPQGMMPGNTRDEAADFQPLRTDSATESIPPDLLKR